MVYLGLLLCALSCQWTSWLQLKITPTQCKVTHVQWCQTLSGSRWSAVFIQNKSLLSDVFDCNTPGVICSVLFPSCLFQQVPISAISPSQITASASAAVSLQSNQAQHWDLLWHAHTGCRICSTRVLKISWSNVSLLLFNLASRKSLATKAHSVHTCLNWDLCLPAVCRNVCAAGVLYVCMCVCGGGGYTVLPFTMKGGQSLMCKSGGFNVCLLAKSVMIHCMDFKEGNIK